MVSFEVSGLEKKSVKQNKMTFMRITNFLFHDQFIKKLAKQHIFLRTQPTTYRFLPNELFICRASDVFEHTAYAVIMDLFLLMHD